ncbi:hypothetical protein OG946_10660 [Streptomyces sp. NBC_01808]|uniref:hypothetical protein n=1 Tax=Streptomyces sp. NBC_01808 TaxID=2975947 RepID=UPI002DDBA42F|nr:hypothetical protein [Streptomyces sp. NBC_01808]WSA37811.1 hypothetical protein OG946_10660 [Streptomyces sp. NBC_01808]
MGQHASRFPSRTHRALLRAGLIAAAAGSALAAGGAAGAAAAPADGPTSTALDTLDELKVGKDNQIDTNQVAAALTGVGEGLDTSKRTALAPLTALQLNPLARTGSDPLDNSVETAVGEGGAPVSTAAVTGPLAEGASLSELPTVGPFVGGLVG